MKHRTNIKTHNNRKALVYARVSSKRQQEEGSGLDSQVHRCREYCAQKGYEVEEEFKDSFTGGGDYALRPGMSALLEHIDVHPHRQYVVVFDDLSRWAREVTTHFQLRKALDERFTPIECTNFTFEDTPEGELVETLMAAQHQYHRKNNQRQVVQKQKACLEGGRWAFGGKKIGYKRAIDPISKRKILVPDANAALVKEALEGFAFKRFTNQIEVARFLRNMKVFGNAPVEKYLKTVRAMLEDKFYAGYIEYPKWEVFDVKGIHEPLITLEVFKLNQKRLAKETLGTRVRHIHNPDFSLGGLVECAECQSPLRYYWSQGRTQRYAYYECKNKGCSLKGKTIQRDSIEMQFNKLLEGYKPKPGLIAVASAMFEDIWAAEIKDAERSQKEILKQKSAAEKDFEKLAEKLSSVEESSATGRQLNILLDKKAKELEQLQEFEESVIDYSVGYRTALDRVLGTLKKPLEMWLSASVFQKQKLFFFFFDKRLAYAANDGYRTAQLSPVLRLFERFEDHNSTDVEIDRIKPTEWAERKTEAIDFSGPFMWFDDAPSPEDLAILSEANPDQLLIEMNLVENPDQLREIVRDVL